MNKVLITGAAGFIGRNLTAHLQALGYAVHAMDVKSHMPPGSTYIADILDSASLEKCFAEHSPETVIHMAARTDLLGKSVADYSANTKGVSNIISVCSACPSVKRVIFASSRMVCRIDHVPVTYTDYSAPNAYGLSKVEGERLVRESKAKFEWVIVRPTSIWGPGFGIPYRVFFDQIRRRRYFHQSGYAPKKSFGFIGNTVFQLESLLRAPASVVDQRTFYLGDYEPLNMRDWADYIHELFGLSGRIPTIPVPLLGAAAKAGDIINYFSRRDLAPLTSFRLDNLLTDMVYPQLAELAEVTGPLPYNWREGSELTVKWLRSK